MTTEGSPHFVPVSQRIATFDNDGTLWSEQPVYFQLQFAIDRVKEMANDHPEWKTQQPFQAVLENDMDALIVDVTPTRSVLVQAKPPSGAVGVVLGEVVK